MIKSGEKEEEYREMSSHWIRRFHVKMNSETGEWMLDLFDFDEVEFTLGYPKLGDESRRISFKKPKIRIGEGKTQWGAMPGKKYFVITWCNS